MAAYRHTNDQLVTRAAAPQEAMGAVTRTTRPQARAEHRPNPAATVIHTGTMPVVVVTDARQETVIERPTVLEIDQAGPEAVEPPFYEGPARVPVTSMPKGVRVALAANHEGLVNQTGRYWTDTVAWNTTPAGHAGHDCQDSWGTTVTLELYDRDADGIHRPADQTMQTVVDPLLVETTSDWRSGEWGGTSTITNVAVRDVADMRATIADLTAEHGSRMSELRDLWAAEDARQDEPCDDQEAGARMAWSESSQKKASLLTEALDRIPQPAQPRRMTLVGTLPDPKPNAAPPQNVAAFNAFAPADMDTCEPPF